jgi:flagellin
MALQINSNLPSLFAQNQLGKTNRLQQSALQKLSSGLKINQAQDNPAGLVISEYLRAQLGGLQQAVRNTQEAYNTLAIAEGGLHEVSSMLTRGRELAVHALNSGVTSSEQVSADQAELNGLLNSIGRIADTTRYSDQQLLNGAQQISFTAAGDTQILDPSQTRIDLVADDMAPVEMTFAGGAANQAERAYVESETYAGGQLTEDVTFTVRGSQGAREFSFAQGTEISEVAAAVEEAAGDTGVNAYSVNGDTQLRLVSEAYGAAASVEVEAAPGAEMPFAAAAGETVVRDTGQDATLSVKGVETTTQGLEAEVANSAFTGRFAFEAGDPTETTIAQTGYDQDTLTDADATRTVQLGDLRGGMQLQLGEGAAASNRETFGLNSMRPPSLGRTTVDGETLSLSDLSSGGRASLARDPEAALAVIDQAIADVAAERGRIGAYQANTLQTNMNSLSVAVENVTATESGIRDTNMARQISEFIRTQILQRTGVMGVQSANANASNVLRLLGGGGA